MEVRLNESFTQEIPAIPSACPLTIISNRAPYQIKKNSGQLTCEKNVGGLVSVLDEILCQAGGTWIAWGEKEGAPSRVGIPLDKPKYALRLIRLAEQEVQNYYHGFSNRVLWPLSHYFLDRCHFRAEYWSTYQAVNQKFAEAFTESSSDHDLVWIHDFHLTLLPALLRKERLNLSKGILERLLAYERFLEKYPEFRRQVCLIQIAVPSRTRVDEYRSLRREIDEAIGRITGRFSTRKWIPLRYLYQSFAMEDVASYYVAADLALITPLRDGMNLVAKEYVACKREPHGSLILSEFTGAAATLTEAILVNPYNVEGLADTIRLSLSMPAEEKKRRMRFLRQQVKERDVYWWCASFLKDLSSVGGRDHD